MALPILDGNQSATTLSTIFTAGAHIPAHTVVSLGSQAIIDITGAVSGIPVSISGTQTTTFGAVTGSVSVLNFPASQSVTFTEASVTFGQIAVSNFPATQTIAGTVTANVSNLIREDYNALGFYGVPAMGKNPDNDTYKIFKTDQNGILSISGTVTANVFGTGYNNILYSLPIGQEGTDAVTRGIAIGFHENLTADEFRSVKASDPLPVQIRAGTVTVGAMPSGALTTRFGSVTTANTAQITSAVTNTSRKYLLAQNISAGTVTIGIGFSPTTTQGIQLPAGGGLTFDAFCPTGAVYWLGAVTGAAFTILEG